MKIEIIQYWVQIISPGSKGLATCHVTRQRCSVGTDKLLIIIFFIALGSRDPEGYKLS